MQEEISKILDKKLDFFTAISEIKGLQSLTDYSLDEFEKICKRRYRSSEFSEKFCDIPLEQEQDLAIRNVATSQMAKLLKIEPLIANSISIKIQNEKGEIHEGILMDLAEGIDFKDVFNKENIKF